MSVPANRSLCLLLLLSWFFAPSSPARYSQNLFVQTCRLAAQELNQTDCWVCALMPSHQGSEFPLQAVPANASELFVERPGKAKRQFEEVLEVGYEAAFPVCFKWLARAGAPDLGTTTRCQTTITRSSDPNPSITGLLPPDLTLFLNASANISQPSPRNFPLLFTACRVWRKPYAACLPEQHWEAQDDFYWVCGHKAYKQLPEEWTGSCALGHVVPAIRVSKDRPAGKIRNARELQQSRDIVNTYMPLTDWDLYLSSVFPQIGVVRVGWAIYRLQAIIELLSNETADVLETFATEQRELRKLALQNRMALDMILASHGGVCALVGAECCVYVPDSSEVIFDHARHIASLGEMPKDDSHEWLLKVKEWLGSWWGSVVGYLVLCFVGLLMLILIVKLMYCLCIRSCNCSPQSSNILPNLLQETDTETEQCKNSETEIDVLVELYNICID